MMGTTRLIAAGAALVSLAAFGTPNVEAATLDDVKAKGHLQCGVNVGLPGFSNADDEGTWTGLDVDVCRAVAAAIFGDADAVKFSPLTAKERFTALQSGEIDVLSRNTTWTLSRDTSLGLDFVGVTYYDGQGFMVPKGIGIDSALELDGASVCVQTGTTTELNLADFFRANKMSYEPVVYDKADEIIVAFQAGRCDVYTTDASGLFAERIKFDNPDDWKVLPEIISKEPLGPVVRHGDNAWGDVIRWSLYAMIEAEEFGITSANVDDMKDTGNPAINRLLGTEGEMGDKLGLSADWAYNIIKLVGNYGESFERNVGEDTPLGIARGLNSNWLDGGLIYAMPMR